MLIILISQINLLYSDKQQEFQSQNSEVIKNPLNLVFNCSYFACHKGLGCPTFGVFVSHEGGGIISPKWIE